MNDEAIKKLINETITQRLSFTKKVKTDTPLDAYDTTPRAYVNLNGVSANRPTASVVGQQYLDMTLASGRGRPIWWNGTGFVDADGTYV